jgi:hypothetical protein
MELEQILSAKVPGTAACTIADLKPTTVSSWMARGFVEPPEGERPDRQARATREWGYWGVLRLAFLSALTERGMPLAAAAEESARLALRARRDFHERGADHFDALILASGPDRDRERAYARTVDEARAKVGEFLKRGFRTVEVFETGLIQALVWQRWKLWHGWQRDVDAVFEAQGGKA